MAHPTRSSFPPHPGTPPTFFARKPAAVDAGSSLYQHRSMASCHWQAGSRRLAASHRRSATAAWPHDRVSRRGGAGAGGLWRCWPRDARCARAPPHCPCVVGSERRAGALAATLAAGRLRLRRPRRPPWRSSGRCFRRRRSDDGEDSTDRADGSAGAAVAGRSTLSLPLVGGLFLCPPGPPWQQLNGGVAWRTWYLSTWAPPPWYSVKEGRRWGCAAPPWRSTHHPRGGSMPRGQGGGNGATGGQRGGSPARLCWCHSQVQCPLFGAAWRGTARPGAPAAAAAPPPIAGHPPSPTLVPLGGGVPARAAQRCAPAAVQTVSKTGYLDCLLSTRGS